MGTWTGTERVFFPAEIHMTADETIAWANKHSTQAAWLASEAAGVG
jgi:hypothetical protein